jgi:N-carbamoylputrescine amidase
LSLQGATAVFIPSACAGDSKNIWDLILRANAVSNLVFICAANRIGTETNMTFYGRSLIINPLGEILRMGSEDREEIVTCDLEESVLKSARERWPFFRDLRLKTYFPFYGKVG